MKLLLININMLEDENVENNEEKNQDSLKPQQDIPEDIYQDLKNENNLNNEIKQTNEKSEISQQNTISDFGQHHSDVNENLHIDLENEKKENIKQENENDKKEENPNKINLISNQENEINEEIESLKIDDYINQQQEQNQNQEQEIFTNNDEYDDTDLTSCRLTHRNNNNKYLLIKEEDKNNANSIKNDNGSDDEEEEEKEDLFPFRIIGDVRKKSNILGKYNNRYLELDAKKGLFKRYMSSKEYPKNPKEIIDIRNFKLIKKLKLVKEYYDFEITYTVTNKKGVKSDKIESFRLRHCECRNKWFDSLLLIWKYLVKGEPVPKITKNILLFVDDRIGIIQEIGRENKKKKIKSEMNLRKFKILGLLGVGGFGTVFKVKHALTDKIYAMKVMNKNYIIQKKYLHYIVSEFEIMKSLSGFPFVLDLHYCFQSANYLYLIIDYCPNGDFTKLKSINNLKLFFAEVILAFEHIHNHNIIYRDLKPENILLDATGHIKVCDFNLAKAGMTKNKRADSFCGSPMYFSPEMLLGKGVDYKCDIYGIGLLIYELVTNTPAFNARNLKSLYDLIKKNKINFNVSGLHGDIKDLIEKILVKEPAKRLDIEDIKKHPYFKDIDFDKVLKKEYGRIETVKNKKKNEQNNIEDEKNNISEKEKERKEYEKFKLLQQQLDDEKDYTVLDGKVSVKEMMLDQKRVMKNFVREFYYVKKEDIELTKDYKLDVKEGNANISSLIDDNYEYEA